jgi:hypothetical protein
MKDYYKILGLERNASPDLIRQRFRELAFENHPDVSKDERSADAFIEIYESYNILCHPEKKLLYDQLYDTYATFGRATTSGEDKLRNDIRDFSAEARERARQKAKEKYRDFIRDLDCFFISGKKADGAPFLYSMHRNTGISGGIGPMGTIRARVIEIPIPRSALAHSLHRTGFMIKAIFLALAILLFYLNPLPGNNPANRIILSSLTVLAGGMITKLFYRLAKVKSKFFHARHYPLVKKYRSKGYTRGFHPVLSTTPAGILAWLLRLLF